MAVLLTKKPNNITEYPNAFKRQGAFPLEADSIYKTLADAQKYAKEDPVAYVTQLLAVAADDGTVVYYVIADEEGSLFKLGSSEMDLDELDKRLDEIEKFFAKLDGESFDKALDTLIEAQERINLIYDDKDAEGNAKEPSGLLVDETNRAIAAEEKLNEKIDDLDFEYDAKSESKNKTYFVKTVAQKEGLVSITREQLPDIEISATTAIATTLSNGGSFIVLTSIDEVEDATNTDNGHKILKTTKEFTIPKIAIELNDNLTLNATVGKITIGHSTALAGNDAATNEVVANSSATLQLKDTDGLKFVKTTYDTNGHKNGSTQTEYKMPKLTTWTWASTATQVTATLGGNGITTLNIPNMPFASTTQSGVVSATAQSFAGNKTFSNNISVAGTASINNLSATTATVATLSATNANIKGIATINNLQVSTIAATNTIITTATINTLTSSTSTIGNLSNTNATIGSATITNAAITNATITAIKATNATITNATVGNLQVATENATTSNIGTANITALNATTATIATLNITATANINNLVATNATIAALKTTNATVTNATITNATVNSLNAINATVTSTAQINNLSATTATITTLNVNGNSTFAGTVTIDKDLVVNGTTTSVDFETAVTKENLIVANATGGSIAGKLSGLAIRVNDKNTENAYGVVYDTSNEVIKLGLGTVNENNGYEFTFKEGEDETIATREWVNGKTATIRPEAHSATALVGSATYFARQDHVHPVSALTIKFATTTTNNTSTTSTTTFDTSAVAIVTIGPASIGVSPGATKVATSATNGNIKIDNVEKTVYTHPAYTAATQAKVYNITVDNKGHVNSTTAANAGDLLMTGYTATAASITATDSILTAIGKLEQYVNKKNSELTNALQNYVDAIDALVGGN